MHVMMIEIDMVTQLTRRKKKREKMQQKVYVGTGK